MKMYRILIALLLAALASPSYAQWQTPNHSVPIGRGAGVTGFGSASGAAGVPLLGGGSLADPAFGPLGNAGLAPAPAQTAKCNPTTGTAAVQDCTISQLVTMGLAAGTYTTPLTGGVSRTFNSKLGDVIEAKDFGVVCDGTTPTGAQLQNALNAAAQIGGTLHISAQNTTGACIVSRNGATSYALSISQPMHLVCDSGVAIKPDATVNAGVSVLYLFGSANGLNVQTVIEGCFIGDPSTAMRNGLHGIVFDTQGHGVYFRAPIVKNVFIQAGSSGNGYGILVINNPDPTTGNPNGGTYGAFFGEASMIQGGIGLLSAGDSITIRGIVPYNGGTNADNNGILVNLVNGAGALILDNVNFSQPKGVKVDCAYNILINGGEYEGQAALTGNALMDFNAGACTTQSVKIRNAQFQYVPGFGTPLLLRISANNVAVVVDGCAFSTPTGYTGVSNASTTLQLGPNFWSTGATHISGTAPANTYGGG